MVDNILYSKFVFNMLSQEEMAAVEKELIATGEIDSIIQASIANYEVHRDLADKMLGADEEFEENSLISARNVNNNSSIEVTKNKTIMEAHNFITKNSKVLKDLMNKYNESEDKSLSLDSNLIRFYINNVDGASVEEAQECVASMRTGITSFMENLSKALDGDLESVLANVDGWGSDLELVERYELLLNLLAFLNVLNIKNLNQSEMIEIETFEAIRKGLLKADGAVTDYDIEQLIIRIKEEISNHSHVATTLSNFKEVLHNMSSETNMAIYSNGDQMRKILILSMVGYVGMKNGECEATTEGVNPEMFAIRIAEQYQSALTLEKMAKGEISEDRGLEILKAIAVVALVTIVSVSVAMVAAIGLEALLLGLFLIFDESIILPFVVMVVIACALFMGEDELLDAFEWTVDKILEIIERTYDCVKHDIFPAIEEVAMNTWTFIKNKVIAVKDWIQEHLTR